MVRRPSIPLLLTLCVLVVGQGRAAEPPSGPGADTLPLWVADGKPGRVYLFGTVHVGRQDMYPLDPAVLSAFDGATALAVEADIAAAGADAAAKLLVIARLPAGTTLSGLLGERDAARVRTALEKHMIPLAAVDSLEPWFVAMTIEVLAASGRGFDPALGIDLHLLKRAAEAKKPIIELEGLDAQLALFDRLPRDAGLALLRTTLEETDGIAALERIIESWKRGDEAALDGLLNEGRGQGGGEAALYKLLISKRNLGMAKRAIALAADGPVFVAVGAAHLVGPDGVPALLRRRGFTVRQLQRGEVLPRSPRPVRRAGHRGAVAVAGDAGGGGRPPGSAAVRPARPARPRSTRPRTRVSATGADPAPLRDRLRRRA
jgi:uncharacterized protein YbaP (TraB family)